MSSNHPKPGAGYVPEYQVSSWPYLTSSQLSAGEIREVSFPGVTRWVVVHNLDHGGGSTHDIKFGMTRNCFLTTNANYYDLHAGEQTPRLELKCTKLFLSSSSAAPFSIIAGYTGINTGSLPVMTGSSGWQGIG
jgi:hypothetical protein